MTTDVPDLRRIAIISDNTQSSLGGAQNAFYEQVTLLGNHYDVTAMSSAAPRLAELGTHPGVTSVSPPIWFEMPAVGAPFVRNTKAFTQFFVDTFKERDIQLVHIHSEMSLAAGAVTAAKKLGLPVVHTVHTFFWQTNFPLRRAAGWGIPIFHNFITALPSTHAVLDDDPANSALRNMTLTVAQHVDQVISPSSHQADRLRAAGLKNVTVVPNTLATVPPNPQPVTDVGRPLRLVWIGRFALEKRVHEFIRSVRMAMDELPPGSLEVELLGGGDQLGRARKLARDYPGIDVVGRVPHDEVHERLARAHASVLTSVGWDNQPMVVVESVNALRGVIVSDPDLREGLVGPGIPAYGTDEGVLARRLVELVNDPTPLIEASQACLSARDEFAVDTFIESTNRVYAAALAG